MVRFLKCNVKGELWAVGMFKLVGVYVYDYIFKVLLEIILNF